LSSLVEVGRGGLPPDPDGYLPSLDLGQLARSGVAVSSTGGLQAARPAPLGLVAALSGAGCAP
jgi:hypothetical protein